MGAQKTSENNEIRGTYITKISPTIQSHAQQLGVHKQHSATQLLTKRESQALLHEVKQMTPSSFEAYMKAPPLRKSQSLRRIDTSALSAYSAQTSQDPYSRNTEPF
jgi:hypothetical protein